MLLFVPVVLCGDALRKRGEVTCWLLAGSRRRRGGGEGRGGPGRRRCSVRPGSGQAGWRTRRITTADGQFWSGEMFELVRLPAFVRVQHAPQDDVELHSLGQGLFGFSAYLHFFCLAACSRLL